MKKVISIICFLSILKLNVSLGQPTGLDKVLPLSPEVSSFMRSGEFSVNYYTGTPNISIPLFTLKEQDFSLPLSLDYSGTAIRVNDLPTWVGLGWNFLPGGCITQVPYGQQDLPGNMVHDLNIYNQLSIGKEGQAPAYLTHDSNRNKYGFFVAGENWSIFPISSISINSHPENILLTDMYQPDIYMFNFLGYSGSFYINPFTDEIKFLSKEDHVVFEDQRATNDGWKATMPNGVKIYFFIKEASFSQQAGSIQSFSWKISKIELVNGEQINFSYTSKEYNNKQLSYYHSDFFLTMNDRDLNENSLAPVSPPNGINSTTHISYTNRTEYLNKIESTHYVINFEFTNEMKPRLSKIHILNKSDNQIAKRFTFDYTEFNHAGEEWDIGTNQSQVYSKYKLTNLNESYVENGIEAFLSPYTFTYIEDLGLPHITSLSQDYWGFYNGELNTTLLPDESRMLTTNHFSGLEVPFLNILKNSSGAHRYVSSEHLQQGMLKQIKYPTQGKTVFSYEPHVFSYSAGRFRTKGEYLGNYNNNGLLYSEGAGLRIKEIINYDNNEDFINRKIFGYSNSGILLQPIHFWNIVPMGQSSGNDYGFYHNYNIASQNLYAYPLISSLVGYSFVDIAESCTESESISEEPNGRVSYQFHNSEMYDYSFGIGELNYGYLSELNHKNGLIQTQKYFDKENSLLQKIDYKYELVESENFDAIKLERIFSCDYCLVLGRDHIYRIEFYPMNTRIWKQNEIIENTYHNNILAFEKETIVEFGPAPFYFPFKQQEKRSGEEAYNSTLYLYPNDYLNTTGFIGEMKAKGVLDKPIESVSYINENGVMDIIGGSLTTYKVGIHSGLPESLYLFKTLSPVPLSNFRFSNQAITGQIPGQNGVYFFNELYYKRISTFNRYDEHRNLLQQTQEHGVPVSYIWGYKKQYPVAKIIGSDYNTAIQYVDLNILDNHNSDVEIRVELDKLHQGLSNAQVTTYTYDPLIGMSSETDASGKTIYYEYDETLRLKNIKDQDGNILKNHTYHYKPQ